MAGTPPSTQQTRQRFLDVRLNAALLDFAPRYTKDQLEHLARECDQRLERELLPQLHAILCEIDLERDTFEAQKQDAARELRSHLGLLRFDASIVNAAIDQLQTVAPRYFALVPRAPSLELPISARPPLPTPNTTAISDGTLNTSGAHSDSRDAILPLSTPEISIQKPLRSLPQPLSLDSQVQAQVIVEGSVISCTPKREDFDPRNEIDTSPKRQRLANEMDISEAVRHKMKRRIAFPNLMTGECIFRHAERKGFFVVRCDFCEPGIFTEPPLLYNRALKHLKKHGETTSGERELTNEAIFEKFAFQVDGDEMASKYWIREHLGVMPHTFTPSGSSGVTSRVYGIEEATAGRQQETDDDFSPFPELRESPRGRQLDCGEDQENPRRARRNVPRPDYAEMVANKDPWNISEIETERTSTAVGVTRSTASKKRRLTKPGVAPKSRPTESKKPFGYMTEPWPRRSAPR